MTIWVRIGAISLMVLILTLTIWGPIAYYKHSTKLFEGWWNEMMKVRQQGAIESLIFNIVLIDIPFVIPFLLVAIFG